MIFPFDANIRSCAKEFFIKAVSEQVKNVPGNNGIVESTSTLNGEEPSDLPRRKLIKKNAILKI